MGCVAQLASTCLFTSTFRDFGGARQGRRASSPLLLPGKDHKIVKNAASMQYSLRSSFHYVMFMFLCQNNVQTLSKKSHGPTLMSREAGDGRKQRRGERYRNGQREKFGQLIFRRIIEIVVTRCQILKLKCTKFELSRNAEASDLQVY